MITVVLHYFEAFQWLQLLQLMKLFSFHYKWINHLSIPQILILSIPRSYIITTIDSPGGCNCSTISQCHCCSGSSFIALASSQNTHRKQYGAATSECCRNNADNQIYFYRRDIDPVYHQLVFCVFYENIILEEYEAMQ